MENEITLLNGPKLLDEYDSSGYAAQQAKAPLRIILRREPRDHDVMIGISAAGSARSR
ncbi:MAG: hypothetical protein WAZ77_04485 [Candidatus Nitrosopolaris sp.]